MFWKVVIFIIVTLIFTAFLAVVQQKINLSFEKIVLPQLAPALGMFVVLLIYRNTLLSVNLSFDKIIFMRSVIALVVPIFLFLFVFLIGKQTGLNVTITDNLSSVVPVMFLGMLIGAVAEEIGWRSFLQPTLEKSNTVLIAAILVGTIWGLWHIGHYKNGFLFMAGFLLFTISASIIIVWLLRDTKYNLISATLFHLSINSGFLIFLSNSLTDNKLMIINGIVWLIPALIIVVTTGFLRNV
jgi:membrane protease YdiL (CAAX protease family)